MIDMHVHSTESDGRLSIEEIQKTANKNHIDEIAITDHDILMSADPELCNTNIIKAVEFGITYKNKEVHILGYYVDSSNEKLTKQMQDKEVVSQNLAFPINISLTDELMEIYANNKNIFEELGYESDVFSDDSVVIRAVPYLFGNSNAEFLFTDILDTIAKNSNDPFDVIESKVIKRSCKMSVKSGDTLSNFEIIKLLEDLFKCEYPLTCPHGRPTFIEMNEKDLEKMFMRIK